MANFSDSRWVVIPQMAECRWRFSAENVCPLPWKWVLSTDQVGPAPWGESSFRWTAHIAAWWEWRKVERLRRLQRTCAARMGEARRG